MTGSIELDTEEFPVSLWNLETIEYPVQAVTVPANLYIGASLVVKADFGALGYVDNDWQSVYAQIPFDLAPVLEATDTVVASSASFGLGGITRQETPAFHSDNWGVALDQIDSVIPLPAEQKVILTYRLRNLGQCQIPNVCLTLDLLVFRARLHHADHAPPPGRSERPRPHTEPVVGSAWVRRTLTR